MRPCETSPTVKSAECIGAFVYLMGGVERATGTQKLDREEKSIRKIMASYCVNVATRELCFPELPSCIVQENFERDKKPGSKAVAIILKVSVGQRVWLFTYFVDHLLSHFGASAKPMAPLDFEVFFFQLLQVLVQLPVHPADAEYQFFLQVNEAVKIRSSAHTESCLSLCVLVHPSLSLLPPTKHLAFLPAAALLIFYF